MPGGGVCYFRVGEPGKKAIFLGPSGVEQVIGSLFVPDDGTAPVKVLAVLDEPGSVSRFD